ncbi:hypothetical protein Q7C_2575 [Methylophaga frappieri]|uniref:Uncharacterized protein n=1 Tax=Methylophaga frappieri (strain ATCC BAA-2434 / DSM 25690 / JAM7) TaxID=754477 RepID=I1YLA3_METFJ|nr:hypothetical protein [Methylophaga frappieri]AFJ03696.1 hypothetical protein Q7C_2575 [Methylophaga frappieri]
MHDKLAAARQQRRRRLLQTVSMMLILSMAGIGAIYWAAQPDPSTPAVSTQPDNLTPSQNALANEQARAAYLDAYAQFDSTLKPQLSNTDIKAWRPDLATQLSELESQAVTHFAAGDYLQAQTGLSQLVTLAEQTIAEVETAFSTSMITAQNAFDNNDYPVAKQSINTAMLLNTSDKAAQDLAERIEQIPKITDLIRQINAAQSQQNKQLERSLISQLLQLTPERTVYQQRAAELETLIKTDQFNEQIRRAYRALEDGQVDTAQSALKAAKQIYPAREEVKNVQQAIQQYQQKQQISTLQKQIATARRTDDWQAVLTHLQALETLVPQAASHAAEMAKARQIVSLDKAFTTALAAPFSLSAETAANQMRSAITNAKQYRADSVSLAQKTDKVADLLTALNQPVAVTINSDKQTFVSVRGVGKVGEVISKTIQLKPGQYTLEGKRVGYKSKLKTIDVPLDHTPVSLTLICDEAI